jgi:hypothetical protein
MSASPPVTATLAAKIDPAKALASVAKNGVQRIKCLLSVPSRERCKCGTIGSIGPLRNFGQKKGIETGESN